MRVVFFFVEFLDMMIDFSSGDFWSNFSFSATNDHVCGFNSKNGTDWHENYVKYYYCYKRATIYGVLCLRSRIGVSESGQRDIKPKSPSKVFFFSKLDNFWSIRRYINSLINLVKIPLVIPIFYSKINWCILKNPHDRKDESFILKVRLKIVMFVVKTGYAWNSIPTASLFMIYKKISAFWEA